MFLQECPLFTFLFIIWKWVMKTKTNQMQKHSLTYFWMKFQHNQTNNKKIDFRLDAPSPWPHLEILFPELSYLRFQLGWRCACGQYCRVIANRCSICRLCGNQCGDCSSSCSSQNIIKHHNTLVKHHETLIKHSETMKISWIAGKTWTIVKHIKHCETCKTLEAPMTAQCRHSMWQYQCLAWHFQLSWQLLCW